MENIDSFLAEQRSLLDQEIASLSASSSSYHDSNDGNNNSSISPNNSCSSVKWLSDADNHDDNNCSSIDRDSIQTSFSSNHDVANPFQVSDRIIQNQLENEKFVNNISVESSTRQVNANAIKQPGKNLINCVAKNDMDSWATDAFYEYFPSFGDDRYRKEHLSRTRKQEYNDYLKQIAHNDWTNIKKNPNLLNDEPSYKDQIETSDKNLLLNDNENTKFNKSRNKLIEDLKHTDLPSIFYSNAIQVRNQRVSQEKNLKKMEYQKELIKQIEEKKREMEIFRAKEKEEEERLTKKLEEQLKTMQLEEELSKEKLKNDRARLANEQNHIYRMHLLTQLGSDHKASYNPYVERKAQSENGKDKFIEPISKPYNHFTNSAPNNHEAMHDRSSSVMLVNNANDSSSQNVTSYCRRCREHLYENMCELCERRRHIHEGDKQCIRCNNHLQTAIEQRNGICKNCKKSNIECMSCRKNDQVCPSCNVLYCLRCRHRKVMADKPSIREESSEDETGSEMENIRRSKRNIKSRKFTINYKEKPDHDLEVNPVVIRNDNKPYSMNLPMNSIFNKGSEKQLSVNIRNGEVFLHDNLEDVRRKTDERIAKYAKNYSDLRNKPSRYIHQKYYDNQDSFPMPLLKYDNVKQQNEYKTKGQTAMSPAVKMLESKWTIPAVQKHTVKTKPIRVFTQLGAIRKQLQMEQLNFDST